MSHANVEDIYLLTPIQAGLLFHSVAEPQDALYWTQYHVDIEGPLDEAHLQQAWRLTVARHAALRTVFVWDNRDQPLQVVRREMDLDWTSEDLSGLSAEQQATAFAAWLERDRAAGCDLKRGPVVRFALFRFAADRYRFVFNNHHVVVDGWSLYLALGEAFDAYDQLSRGETPALAPAPQFRRYVDWRAKQTWSDAETYFRAQLAGIDAPTPLVPVRTRETVEDFGTARSHLSATETAALTAFARASRVTVNTVMQAAWGLVLSRYSGESDVMFGVVLSGRGAPLEGIERIVGLFINTLPTCHRIDTKMPVTAWLSHVQQLQAHLLHFQHVSLADVHGWSDVPRSEPLFQSIFAFENYPVPEGWNHRSSGITLGDARSVERTNFPLMVMAGVSDRGTDVVCHYDARRLAPEMVERLVGHYVQLVRGLVTHPDATLGDVPMLTAAEVDQLKAWTRTAAPVRETSVHALFEQQVRETPNQIALLWNGAETTYAQLDARSNQLAHHLRRQGITAEDRVGVCLTRSPEMVVALLAVLKAGAAYVPLDPAFPPQRTAFVLEDANARLLVTESAVLDAFPAMTTEALCIDRQALAIASESTASLNFPVSPRHLAYVIYTSGSTGQPKGVQLEHRGVVNFLDAMRIEPGLSPADVLLAVTTVSFDIAVLELFLPLTTGARVVLAPPDAVRDGHALRDLITRHGVTCLQATPVTWQVMLEAGWSGTKGLKALCGGEPLPHDLAAALIPKCAELWNMYGPTETTVWSTCRRITSPEHVDIGHPIANTDVFVVDAGGQLVPVEVPGELVIGGAGLARGYLARPELTADRFIPHPFEKGALAYRTGDRARWLQDGNLDCLGRADNQVKVRGFRIELGEIETVLAQHAAVQQSVVVVKTDPAGDARLVAYLTITTADSPTTDELRAHLGQSLPEYMVPSAFVVLDRLPLTPNGKVDRKALPDVVSVGHAPAEAFAEPRTDIERALAAMWADLLKVERISRDDNFFRIGGHSLLAMRLVNRVNTELQVPLSPAALFQHPVLSSLAAHIAAVMTPAGTAAPEAERENVLVQIEPGGSGTPFFWVHGIGGEVFSYLSLSRHLGKARPVYGFTADWTRLASGRVPTYLIACGLSGEPVPPGMINGGPQKKNS